MFEWLGNWWNSAELWLTQLWFPLQFAFVIALLLPVCIGVAWLIDRIVDRLSARLTRVRDAQPPVVTARPGGAQATGRTAGTD